MKLEKWVGFTFAALLLIVSSAVAKHFQRNTQCANSRKTSSEHGRADHSLGPRLNPAACTSITAHFRAHRQCPGHLYSSIQVTQFTFRIACQQYKRF